MRHCLLRSVKCSPYSAPFTSVLIYFLGQLASDLSIATVSALQKCNFNILISYIAHVPVFTFSVYKLKC